MSVFSSFRKNKSDTHIVNDDIHTPVSETTPEPELQTVKARKRRPSTQHGLDGARAMPVDPVLPEKKRARRRLVGAVALVLAAIIVLPMVLDSEPKPLPSDVAIEIPQPPANPRVVAPKPSETGKADPAGNIIRAEKLSDHVAEKIDDKGGNVGPKGAEKVGVKMPENDASPASSNAPVSSSPDSKPTKFTVQVGAFASQEKVSEVRGKLKAAGVISHTQKVATDAGERVRIRVGPFDSRAEADKMRAKLVAIGLNGTISYSSSP